MDVPIENLQQVPGSFMSKSFGEMKYMNISLKPWMVPGGILDSPSLSAHTVLASIRFILVHTYYVNVHLTILQTDFIIRKNHLPRIKRTLVLILMTLLNFLHFCAKNYVGIYLHNN